MNEKYDIFISYRRNGGDSTAKILHDKLQTLGYHVFFDIESLRSGDFNKALYSVIDECRDFILVLSPGCLDRCEDENDWVRLEIEYALAKNLNIVPIILRGFCFPEQLPQSIDALRYKNGIESNYQFFDAFIKKLQDFLVSSPSSPPPRKRIALSMMTIVLLLILIPVILLIVSGNRNYPRTNKEQNVTRNLLYYVQTNLQQLEQASEYLDKSYQACEEYLAHIGTASHSSLLAELDQNKQTLEEIDTDNSLMSDDLQAELKNSPFNAADAAAMHDYLNTFIESCIDNINYIEFITEDSSVIDTKNTEKILGYYRDILSEELNYISCNTNQLLLAIENEHALETFKFTFLPELYYIPLKASDWRYDEKSLESDEDKCWNAIEKIQNKINSLTGDHNLALMQIKWQLIQSLTDKGASSQEAEQMVESLSGKIQLVAQEELAVEELKKELDEKYDEARKKFAPSKDDDLGILWGKMLRFLNLSLNDEAIKCIDIYREKARSEDEYAVEYCAAAVRFIKNISKTGINYGLMVVGYEPDALHHEQYQIGDIIIAVNGNPCHNYEEYKKIKDGIPSDQNFSVIVLRESDEKNGNLEQIELVIPASASKVLLSEMTEKTYE
ncbi:MAG: toll/interleukin-1 receptor domain-containing protein [Lachnospiraceae bacterium]|nr:toll/interleukin-1 receptor domain-containing protein [Lachnospiraceae bacterium]